MANLIYVLLLGISFGSMITFIIIKIRDKAKFKDQKFRCSCGRLLPMRFDGVPIECKCGKVRVFSRKMIK